MRSAGFLRAGWLGRRSDDLLRTSSGVTCMSALGQKRTCAVHYLMSALCQ